MDINTYLEGFRDGYEKAVRNNRPTGQIEAALRKQKQLMDSGHIVTNIVKFPEVVRMAEQLDALVGINPDDVGVNPYSKGDGKPRKAPRV